MTGANRAGARGRGRAHGNYQFPRGISRADMPLTCRFTWLAVLPAASLSRRWAGGASTPVASSGRGVSATAPAGAPREGVA